MPDVMERSESVAVRCRRRRSGDVVGLDRLDSAGGPRVGHVVDFFENFERVVVA